MENLITKNKTAKAEADTRNLLILLQALFIGFLLVAEWTPLNEKIKVFFFMLNIGEWGKIMFYIPLIFVLHTTLLKSDKYYYFNLFVYATFFVLETMTLIVLISDNVELNAKNAIVLNVLIKAAELGVVAKIISILYKMLEKKELKTEDK